MLRGVFLARTMVPWVHIATRTWDTQEQTRYSLVYVDLEAIGRLPKESVGTL